MSNNIAILANSVAHGFIVFLISIYMSVWYIQFHQNYLMCVCFYICQIQCFMLRRY